MQAGRAANRRLLSQHTGSSSKSHEEIKTNTIKLAQRMQAVESKFERQQLSTKDLKDLKSDIERLSGRVDQLQGEHKIVEKQLDRYSRFVGGTVFMVAFLVWEVHKIDRRLDSDTATN